MTCSTPFNGKLLLILFMRDTFLTNTTKINKKKKKIKIPKYKTFLYLIMGSEEDRCIFMKGTTWKRKFLLFYF